MEFLSTKTKRELDVIASSVDNPSKDTQLYSITQRRAYTLLFKSLLSVYGSLAVVSALLSGIVNIQFEDATVGGTFVSMLGLSALVLGAYGFVVWLTFCEREGIVYKRAKAYLQERHPRPRLYEQAKADAVAQYEINRVISNDNKTVELSYSIWSLDKRRQWQRADHQLEPKVFRVDELDEANLYEEQLRTIAVEQLKSVSNGGLLQSWATRRPPALGTVTSLNELESAREPAQLG